MELTFFGHSCWGVSVGTHRILIDPYPIGPNEEVLIRDFARACDVVLVTHGAADHLGIAIDLLQAVPTTLLVSEPAVVYHARSLGLDPTRARVIAWNGQHSIGRWLVRAIEVRHASFFESHDGQVLSGMPLGFIVGHEDDDEVRVAHLGDTSLFSDLKLLGLLYRPTVALLGIGAATDFLAEMTPQEGALAALWLGADLALPMHYEADPSVARDFCSAVKQSPRAIRTWVPETGMTCRIERSTTITRL